MPRGYPRSKDEITFPDPAKRRDGEMYARPEPNPFTSAWEDGYDDGADGRPASVDGTKLDVVRYMDGYEAGTADRLEVDSIGSSNA